MKTRQPAKATARGPIHLEIDVPPTTARPGRQYLVSLDTAKAALVHLAADHLGLKVERFLQALLSGSLRVEVLPLPAAKVARWRQNAEQELAKLSPRKRRPLEQLAREQGHATFLDLVTEYEWSKFVQVRVSLGSRRRLFFRPLWSRVEEFVGVQQPAKLVWMPASHASAHSQDIAA